MESLKSDCRKRFKIEYWPVLVQFEVQILALHFLFKPEPGGTKIQFVQATQAAKEGKQELTPLPNKTAVGTKDEL